MAAENEHPTYPHLNLCGRAAEEAEEEDDDGHGAILVKEKDGRGTLMEAPPPVDGEAAEAPTPEMEFFLFKSAVEAEVRRISRSIIAS